MQSVIHTSIAIHPYPVLCSIRKQMMCCHLDCALGVPDGVFREHPDLHWCYRHCLHLNHRRCCFRCRIYLAWLMWRQLTDAQRT